MDLDASDEQLDCPFLFASARSGFAKKNLEDCSLYAPFSGVVGQRRISAGETALPGVPVLTLLEVGRVKVRFSVPEQEIARLEEIVAALEKGDAPLADSLALFEEGTKLIAACSQELDAAEQKVVKLMKGPDGAPVELPFDTEEE